jgi:hypothetical protein
VHGWQGNYLTVYDTGRLGGTASLPSARPTASGITFTPPASTTPASTSAPAATARRRSLTRSPNITRSATPSRTRADTSSSRTRSSTTTRLGSASTHRKATYPRPARHLRREHRSATPTITSTALSRCTIVRGHRIVANNNLSVPSNTSSERPGWGIGIVRLGAYCDLVTKNVLARNRTVGVLGLEFPWSRPARRAPVHFQLAGNRIERNAVTGSRIGIAIEVGLFGSKRSTNNCFSKNRYASLAARRAVAVQLRQRATDDAEPARGVAEQPALSELIGMFVSPLFIDDRARGAQPRRRTSEHGPQSRLSIACRVPGSCSRAQP